MAFFNPKELGIVDLLSHDASFTTLYLIDNVILPLVNQHAQRLGDIGCRKLHPHFENSKCRTIRHLQEQMVS
jgi:hypothetical protein